MAIREANEAQIAEGGELPGLPAAHGRRHPSRTAVRK